MNLLQYFNKKRKLSPDHIGAFSLDKQRYVDLSRQRIDCSKLSDKYLRCNFAESSFTHSNTIYWIGNKTFIDSIFHRTKFGAAAEHGNQFYGCVFEAINLKEAILGYNASLYSNCIFKNVKFGAFIKPQFKECKFIDCDFCNVDFQASSFEDCTFVGTLSSAWFRGNFPTDSLKKEFGRAKQNTMHNVSFEGATLHDVTFSDDCDLSTVLLPKQGRYLFFDNWDEQLNTIKRNGATNQSSTTNEDIASFVEIHKVHSGSQKYYILNIADLLTEYSEKAVAIITENATSAT